MPFSISGETNLCSSTPPLDCYRHLLLGLDKGCSEPFQTLLQNSWKVSQHRHWPTQSTCGSRTSKNCEVGCIFLMLKNIWIGKVFLIVMQTLCSFIVLEIYQIRTCISRSSILNHMDHDRIRVFLLLGGCMQDVSVYICIYSENWKYSINILFGIDTGGCTAYETISYAHWPHSDTFISTHKKQQKYDWTILLLNSSVEILFHQWFQTFQWKIICSFDRNKHSLERMCTWMEMMTKTS